jgi:2,4-dienoyl-CoA reductase-like NADH-dependent reductase (Old Yellow Enzyme family)
MKDLLSPLELRAGVVSRNRVWLAPLTNMQSHADGTCSEIEERFLGLRSDGGFGLVETCAAHVSQDGKAWPGELGVHDDAMVPGLTRLAARIHAGGALASVQLFHGGLRADTSVSGVPTISASAYEEAGNATPRAATEDDVARVVEDFARAAKRCAQAGFDSVELHGAHGYLLSQFQSTVYNQRTDRWGGSLPNRCRLIREVTRAVKAAAPSLVLAIRLSPEDFGQAKGIDLDETIQLARWLADDGMEVLHLSLWRSSQVTKKRPDTHATPLFREAVGAEGRDRRRGRHLVARGRRSAARARRRRRRARSRRDREPRLARARRGGTRGRARARHRGAPPRRGPLGGLRGVHAQVEGLRRVSSARLGT